MIKKVLTVAGSDSSGGAGIQADLKTFEEYGTFGFSALTSIVTMDPDEGWSHLVTPIEPDLVERQLKTIFAGAPLDAMKTGMLGTIEAIEITRKYIDNFSMENIVIDPVMACKGTSELLQPENVAAMARLLLPKATITTPNLVEAGILSEMGDLTSVEQMKEAAKKILNLGPKNVVIKGGHRLNIDKAIDLFYDGSEFTIFEEELFATDFNHGAGCTFAAAVTAGLAKGYSVEKSVALAKKFVAAAIKNGQKINPFLGHVWHGAYNHAEDRMNEK
ncbi:MULTISPECIES: bifunctional hydroxymethylpyrimidine kinase/phosphomethylpyrimidine kinase [unclassified Enterococcus]|uniref:bifunctional hydroxymethylpyrimidine kinase/phosphomethylpyrimidine kinase n=1 Tax=unclassified Enterococcus TaxID=2608891 RepID=UPI001CE2128A|nr:MULTISPECIES: bifunctional hydroxymethylpyrimidine kinase/phosphomethylpyrimidine kinase [unclassified Enterococcus]MCA5012656.1 bifunctional hydroxymethylpyrimidine kinase/phosphomethylpyrimidine kinase [Enterococcus sp. S23]MCA5015907.1 bifunctional hydroxymethylpyrimidine kinase/phosphomethylpyrimidine kinase [Enterococcus sp. S22(2020)]